MFWLLPTLADVKSIAFHRSERRRLAGDSAARDGGGDSIKRHRVRSRLPAALPGLASRGCAKHGSPMSNVEVELKTDTGERAPRSAGAATTSHTTQNRHRMALRSAIACRAVH